VDLNLLAKETEGLTGADIEAICREAAMEAIRAAIHAKGNQVTMTMKQFRVALDGLKSRRQK
jgi:transitional endoplasmic reticulum ATPase